MKKTLRLLTASKVDLLKTGCTAWLDTEAVWDDGVSFVARRGNVAHSAVEEFINRLQDNNFIDGVLNSEGASTSAYVATAHDNAGSSPYSSGESSPDRPDGDNLQRVPDVDSDTVRPAGDSGDLSFTGLCVVGARAFLRDYSLIKEILDAEVSFAYGSATDSSGSRIGHVVGKHRDYSGTHPEDRIAGTVDCQVRLRSKLTIIDWKTGGGERAREQLKTLAGIASGGYSDSDVYRILSVEIGPGAEKRNGGLGTFYRVAIDEQGPISEARAHVEDLYNRVVAAENSGLRTVPGPHCKSLYCPYYKNCLRVYSEGE